MPPDEDIAARHHYLATMPRTDHRSSNANSSAMADTDQRQFPSTNTDDTFNTDAFTPKTLSPPTTPSDQGHDVNNTVVDCPFILDRRFVQGKIHYKVLPQGVWQMMPYHRSIDANRTQYSINDTVVIRVMQSGNVVLRSGLILEIKCHDPDRVYIRLYLFYHPEHLPGGRQTFHGRRELMATNHMVVMDAANIVRQANIKHWNEGLGQALPDGLYWRQEFDIPTGTLSQAYGFCFSCSQRLNPENRLIICWHCNILMHPGCLVLMQATRSIKQVRPSGGELKSDRNPNDKIFNIKLFLAWTRLNNDPVHKYEITDLRGSEENRWKQDATCFNCRHLLYERPPEVSPRSQLYHDIFQAAP